MKATDLTMKTLRQLVDGAAPPCVSIYVPLSSDGTERKQAQLRLKNQLDQASRDLEARGIRSRVQDELLQPMRSILKAGLPVSRDAASLAMLRSSNGFEQMALPDNTPETAVVGDMLYIKPLLPFAIDNHRFRVLALSQNDVRLYAGDRYMLEQLDAPNLPPNIAEALGRDDNEEQTLQFHTGAAPANHSGISPEGDHRAAVFHGQVSHEQDAKQQVRRFCELVDNAVRRYFSEHDVPLIIVGIEPVPTIFRQASQYPNLHARDIQADPRLLSETDLHERVWQLMEPATRSAREIAADRLRVGLAKSRGTTDVASALDAAQEGRIGELVVKASQISVSKADVDINQVLAETLRHGGQAVVVMPGQMPEGAQLGALYRY